MKYLFILLTYAVFLTSCNSVEFVQINNEEYKIPVGYDVLEDALEVEGILVLYKRSEMHIIISEKMNRNLKKRNLNGGLMMDMVLATNISNFKKKFESFDETDVNVFNEEGLLYKSKRFKSRDEEDVFTHEYGILFFREKYFEFYFTVESANQEDVDRGIHKFIHSFSPI